jgi:hypothetical protein
MRQALTSAIYISTLLVLFSISAQAQNWSTFLDSSRAVDWSSTGFTIPNYTVNCATQPTLLTGSGNASANTTAIQNALASCDATHNVVNLPAGTYYVAGITIPGSKQVLRGAGANQTDLIFTASAACNGFNGGICMYNPASVYDGATFVLPPSGAQQCSWTAGYSKGTTSITLNSCGGPPPVNSLLILDQANDSTDTSGVYLCDSAITTSCTYNTTSNNHDGRVISGIPHSQQQVVFTTAVSGSGSGPYTVTISPGVYFTNVRSGQAPGAWWSAGRSNDGVENLEIDGSALGLNNITMYGCYQCWVAGVTSVKAARADVLILLSYQDTIRNNYFFQAQSTESDSYGVEAEESSGFLLENNIFQQKTSPIMFGQGSGAVVGYNFSINNQFLNNYVNGSYTVHNAGNEMNLWEGNSFVGFLADDGWGSSDQITVFRNMAIGWAIGRTNGTTPVVWRAYMRDFNMVGNVLGQPGYHNNYEAYATSTTAAVNLASENTSIYSLGWGGGLASNCGTPPCDALVRSTLMRWGNYDTVNAAIQWNPTEASPAANTYVNANFTSTYFGSLSHTLPASLYYSSTPSWWPSGKAWPPIGPDVTTGNVGVCTGGSYAGAQSSSSAKCVGGSLTPSWASHVTSIPAQDCYLSVMGGPPDGTGSVLSFDANTCYNGSLGAKPASPTGLTAIVN